MSVPAPMVRVWTGEMHQGGRLLWWRCSPSRSAVVPARTATAALAPPSAPLVQRSRPWLTNVNKQPTVTSAIRFQPRSPSPSCGPTAATPCCCRSPERRTSTPRARTSLGGTGPSAFEERGASGSRGLRAAALLGQSGEELDQPQELIVFHALAEEAGGFVCVVVREPDAPDDEGVRFGRLVSGSGGINAVNGLRLRSRRNRRGSRGINAVNGRGVRWRAGRATCRDCARARRA